ncbi:NUDIX hydrolase [Bifidobacterium sp. ESL0763]|uniref:NUDIX hydrolase n=1 Tax=Bifidobacterium sp. ESL0763 TaxID=2983227 RepID=UPI0023F87A7E|nr:NUDIX hydrolase [Bifidobacterium sp. ESL0763]MDF7663960.1 NUDIX hydrolase [Bifidobacterium sp. ESL0763]
MTPEPSHDVSALRRGVNAKLGETPDSIDMEAPATVVGQETKYRGAIFHVDDMELALAKRDGGTVHIHRQIVRHPGAVVMLVHDVRRDRYLVEREYRVGPNGFAYGIPAGLMDEGETARQAALRELREETGVVPETEDSIRIRRIARTYSSEGMTDERSYVLGIDLDGWTQGARHFDRDEHVQSAWVSWEELQGVGLMGANSIIAIQSEQLRRLRAEPDR